MGAHIYRRGQPVQRLTNLTPAQLEEIARILGISDPTQVDGIHLSITRQGPSAPPSPPPPPRTP
jgi:hypothetical protein